MGIIRRGEVWFFKARVPRRVAHVDRREFVRLSLHTDSERIARQKAAEIEGRLAACWEAMEAQALGDARGHFEAVRKIAHRLGFTYRTIDEIETKPLASVEEIEAEERDLRDRLIRIARDPFIQRPEIDALAGKVPRPVFTLTEALAAFFDLAADRLDGKSPAQVKRWRAPREKAVRSFVEVVGDRPLDRITREDALAFRQWWRNRVTDEGKDPGSANKDFGHLSDVFRTVVEMHGLRLTNPFLKIRFKEKGRSEVPAYSEKFIRERLLAPGALDGLGEEARSVLLAMVNTGARPSEIIGARAEDFVLDAEVPHLRITAHDGRTLKTDHSRRDVPLLGVSLDAARRLATMARRYQNPDAWSAAVNKFLRENDLRETPAHTAYSLRHAFNDRLTAVECPERIAADLMGHKLARPRYGDGATLLHKAEWIARIAL
jgi:integrase